MRHLLWVGIGCVTRRPLGIRFWWWRAGRQTGSWIVIGCVLLLVTRVFASSAEPQRRNSAADRHAQIARLVRSEFDKDKRGGLTVGVLENGAITWTGTYGFADEKAGIHTSATTIYPIGSVTKVLVGIMLLQLVQQDKVHLADPVERYLPEIKKIQNRFPWAPPITLIQLATMMSGVQANPPAYEAMPDVHPHDSWDKQLLAALPYLKNDYEPGTKREYSNVGYCILALALSRAAGRPFEDYLQSEILVPLGMRDTSFAVKPGTEGRVVRGYFLGDRMSPASAVPNSDSFFLLPAGGLLSTVGDLAKLMQFQLGGGPETVLRRETLENSFRELVSSDGDLRYGDGVGFAAVRNADGHLTALGHGGLLRIGFVASYEFDRATRTGVILLTNTSYGRANYKPMVREILSRLHPTSAGGTGLPPTEEH